MPRTAAAAAAGSPTGGAAAVASTLPKPRGWVQSQDETMHDCDAHARFLYACAHHGRAHHFMLRARDGADDVVDGLAGSPHNN